MSHFHTNAGPESLEDLFGSPISVYTDADAVEDGLLVDVTQFAPVRFLGLPINRMTRHLFDDLAPFVEPEAAVDSVSLTV